MTDCPSCSHKLKTGLFGSNSLLDERAVAIINEYQSSPKQHWCENCGKALYQKAKDRLGNDKAEASQEVSNSLEAIPILTLEKPPGWEFTPLSIVTGQSTTGTGVISEFTSAFTDFFGAQSGRYNDKLKQGEDICKKILRSEALSLGADAILGVDIDYAEVGGGKGMLMVCMSGTAVQLKNLQQLSPEIASRLEKLNALNKRRMHLESLRLPVSE